MILRLSFAPFAALAIAGCDRLPDPATLGEIRVQVRRIEDRDVFLAHAESRIPRNVAALGRALRSKAEATCGDRFVEPDIGPGMRGDMRARRESLDMEFRCAPHAPLPNDTPMDAAAIMGTPWPAKPGGLHEKSSWMTYDARTLRRDSAFRHLTGGNLAAAYEACGGRAVVAERIEARSQSTHLDDRRRMLGARLLYRCADGAEPIAKKSSA